MDDSNKYLLQDLKDSYINALPAKIDEIENEIMLLERGDALLEHYRTLYRFVHSLKGSGGTYGFHIVSTVCHQFEDFLTERGSNETFNRQDIDFCLGYVDALKSIYGALRQNQTDFGVVERELHTLKQSQNENRPSVLLVETSRTTIELCKGVLDKAHAKATFCEDGLTALQRLLHEKFDLLITGNELKTLNGVALIAAIRLTNGVNKNTKAILLTAEHSLRYHEGLAPSEVVTRDANFLESLQKALQKLLKKH